ncbi:MAG: hypothetical protein Q7K45_00080, partial [Nanoarchaeota archaeon]|nr:hypothetical protein [Nanoarchaeota archaeon]
QIKKVRYPMPNPFSAVFECDNEKGNKILRAMENPQHNQWDPENAREKTDEIYKNAKKADKEIREFIRTSLRTVFSANEDEELNVPGLSKYLFIETQEEQYSLDGAGGNSAEADNKGKFLNETAREVGVDGTEKSKVEVAHQIKVIKKTTNISQGGKKKIEVEDELAEGEGGTLGKKGGENPTGKRGRLLKNITLRSYAFAEKDGLIGHAVVLHGIANTKVALEIAAGTDDSLVPIVVKDAEDSSGSSLVVHSDKISGVKINSNGTERIILHFEDNERYALNIQAYEDK